MKLTREECQTIEMVIEKGVNTFMLAPDAELIERVLEQVLQECEVEYGQLN